MNTYSWPFYKTLCHVCTQKLPVLVLNIILMIKIKKFVFGNFFLKEKKFVLGRNFFLKEICFRNFFFEGLF